MKRYLIIAAAAVAVSVLIVSYIGPLIVREKKVLNTESVVKRGEYLVNIMGCNDCHSPMRMGEHGPERDPDRLLSGHPQYIPVGKFDTATTKSWVLFGLSGTSVLGPWGVSFSGNLTSDATGIGNWTEEQFKKAITQGKYKGLDNGRPLLPPMPWENYANMKDEDIHAIYSYLKSTKPVKNIVPAPISPDKLDAYRD